mmetsp:Transcript_6786/g.10923  ORF Transcript_6786/g.10923 Transcript_6786/m.10923 type:complete len:289 (-) Transcript_6786:704-1570(-)
MEILGNNLDSFILLLVQLCLDICLGCYLLHGWVLSYRRSLRILHELTIELVQARQHRAVSENLLYFLRIVNDSHRLLHWVYFVGNSNRFEGTGPVKEGFVLLVLLRRFLYRVESPVSSIYLLQVEGSRHKLANRSLGFELAMTEDLLSAVHPLLVLLRRQLHSLGQAILELCILDHRRFLVSMLDMSTKQGGSTSRPIREQHDLFTSKVHFVIAEEGQEAIIERPSINISKLLCQQEGSLTSVNPVAVELGLLKDFVCLVAELEVMLAELVQDFGMVDHWIVLLHVLQ